MSQAFELEPKKWPKQARSKATFDALVDACTLVLPQLGYAGTTTNHIADAAGAGIASLYEYFPGKDAIIVLTIQNLNNRIFNQLAKRATSIGGLPKNLLMQAWLNEIYECLSDEKELIRVITLEIPYRQQLPQTMDLAQQLIGFAEVLEVKSSSVLPTKQSKASMYLIVNLVVSSMITLVIAPPNNLSEKEVIDELSERLNQWIFSKT